MLLLLLLYVKNLLRLLLRLLYLNLLNLLLLLLLLHLHLNLLLLLLLLDDSLLHLGLCLYLYLLALCGGGHVDALLVGDRLLQMARVQCNLSLWILMNLVGGARLVAGRWLRLHDMKLSVGLQLQLHLLRHRSTSLHHLLLWLRGGHLHNMSGGTGAARLKLYLLWLVRMVVDGHKLWMLSRLSGHLYGLLAWLKLLRWNLLNLLLSNHLHSSRLLLQLCWCRCRGRRWRRLLSGARHIVFRALIGIDALRNVLIPMHLLAMSNQASDRRKGSARQVRLG